MTKLGKLLEALREAQSLFGQIEGAYNNDRAVNRARSVLELTERGFALCLRALDPYPPEGFAPKKGKVRR